MWRAMRPTIREPSGPSPRGEPPPSDRPKREGQTKALKARHAIARGVSPGRKAPPPTPFPEPRRGDTKTLRGCAALSALSGAKGLPTVPGLTPRAVECRAFGAPELRLNDRLSGDWRERRGGYAAIQARQYRPENSPSSRVHIQPRTRPRPPVRPLKQRVLQDEQGNG